MSKPLPRYILTTLLPILVLTALTPFTNSPPLEHQKVKSETHYNYNSKEHLQSEPPSPLTNYTIEAMLNAETHIVSAITTNTYVNHANVPLNELVYHLYPNAFKPNGYITINSIKYNGLDLNWNFVSGVTDQTCISVDLLSGSGPGSLQPEANITLELFYQVHMPNTPDRFGWWNTTSPYPLMAYNMGNWHPIIAVYDDRGWHTAPYTFMGESFYSDVAAYNVCLTLPEDYIMAATGELQSITSGTGTRTWQWTTGPVRDFTWCASPDYKTSSILTDGVNVTSYYTTGHTQGGQRTLEVAEQCLQIYGNLFGSYPWKNLHIVEVDAGFGGMEYNSLVMIDYGLYSSPSGFSSLAIVTAHEIGHEWMPFSIGTDSYAEPWIDEGFASYCEYCWVEFVYGSSYRESYRSADVNNYWNYVDYEGDKCINQSIAYWETQSWWDYGTIAYTKASLVYDMLRYELGNDTFYEAWHYIYDQSLYLNIRASDLQHLFEETVGESLSWFFDQWVFGSGVVTLSLGGAMAFPVLGGWSISFQVTQLQASPVALYVPVVVGTGLGSQLHWVWVNATAVSTASIFVSESPLALALDPDNLLLCRYLVQQVVVALSPTFILLQLVLICIIINVIVILLGVAVYRRFFKQKTQ
ncbi:MAG: M1 family metallopeptidase [Promethearchaeota archaeon]